jgi:serine protease Do
MRRSTSPATCRYLAQSNPKKRSPTALLRARIFVLTVLSKISLVCLATAAAQKQHPDDVEGHAGATDTQHVLGAEKLDMLVGMSATSTAFRIALQRIQPSLVTIESFGGISTVQGRIGGIQEQGEGATTGVVLSPDGYVMTSTFNFIRKQPLISVITHDGVRRSARIIGQDETRKICLMKIDGVNDLKVPEFTKLDEMQVGQWTISVGVGYGDTVPAISKGILSAKNRIGGKAIQTDARISPANYGGPLLDKRGRVMGICVPLDPQSNAVGAGAEWYDSGIGFAIPLDQSELWIERLKMGDTILPPFLGIKARSNEAGKGLWIEHVTSNSAAQDVNLEAGDVILAIDDQRVDDPLRLKQILNRYEAGQEVRLSVLKDQTTEPIELGVKLGAAPKSNESTDPLIPPQFR